MDTFVEKVSLKYFMGHNYTKIYIIWNLNLNVLGGKWWGEMQSAVIE